MVIGITEQEARKVLKEAKSPACDTQIYEAVRKDVGWLLRRRADSGPAPMGATAWIVTDTRRCSPVRPRETAAQAFQRMGS